MIVLPHLSHSHFSYATLGRTNYIYIYTYLYIFIHIEKSHYTHFNLARKIHCCQFQVGERTHLPQKFFFLCFSHLTILTTLTILTILTILHLTILTTYGLFQVPGRDKPTKHIPNHRRVAEALHHLLPPTLSTCTLTYPPHYSIHI